MKFIITNFFLIRHFKPREKFIIIFTILFTLVFSFYDFIRGRRGNLEFLLYTTSVLLLLNIGIYLHRKVQFPEYLVMGLSLYGLLHILGGALVWDGTRLYEKSFLFSTLRYDNFIHIIGSLMGALVIHTWLYREDAASSAENYFIYYFGVFLATLGLGVLNEIVELIGVIFFQLQDKVGDYLNNAVDLVYNTIGAIIGILVIDLKKRKIKNN